MCCIMGVCVWMCCCVCDHPMSLGTIPDITLEPNRNACLVELLKEEGWETEGVFEDEYGDVHDWNTDTNVQHFLCRCLYLHYTQHVSTHMYLHYTQHVSLHGEMSLLISPSPLCVSVHFPYNFLIHFLVHFLVHFLEPPQLLSNQLLPYISSFASSLSHFLHHFLLACTTFTSCINS